MPAATSPASEAWRQANPAEYERSMSSIPLRRLGDPESEIGPVVAFLCSPAAGYITGTTIALDGGQAYLR
jgi:NAD(P)-dependent dehydrogenase (short-subunit alcohol dehydrogenase family)